MGLVHHPLLLVVLALAHHATLALTLALALALAPQWQGWALVRPLHLLLLLWRLRHVLLLGASVVVVVGASVGERN